MENIIVLIIVAIIVVLAGVYIFKSKKSGKKCIGCPYAETCGKNSISSCGSNCDSSSLCDNK